MNEKELKEQLKKEMSDLCETNSSVMTYMECLMRKYENLQSKIDKAIEIDKNARKYFNKQIPRDIQEQNLLNKIYNYLCDIENILKEDK